MDIFHQGRWGCKSSTKKTHKQKHQFSSTWHRRKSWKWHLNSEGGRCLFVNRPNEAVFCHQYIFQGLLFDTAVTGLFFFFSSDCLFKFSKIKWKVYSKTYGSGIILMLNDKSVALLWPNPQPVLAPLPWGAAAKQQVYWKGRDQYFLQEAAKRG